jgi:AcrR family transcriptional regulator
MLNIAPRPTRRTRAKHGGVKPSIETRLLAATERLLRRGHSFATLSVEQLAAEAGMARGTFYLHFRDKGELVARLLDQLTREMVDSFGTWTGDAEIAQRKDVFAAVTGMVRTFKKHQVIVAAVRDTMVADRNVASLYVKMIETIASLARQSVATVRKRGMSRPGATDAVADMLTWAVALYCTHCIEKADAAALGKASQALGYICTSAIFSDDA